jgi:hypothetical protein
MKHLILLIVFIAVLVGGMMASDRSVAAGWQTSTFRTVDGSLVRVGMSKTDVQREAGEPLNLGQPRKQKSARRTGTEKKTGKRRDGEAWTYRGIDGFYIVRFSGETVSRIDVKPDRF